MSTLRSTAQRGTTFLAATARHEAGPWTVFLIVAAAQLMVIVDATVVFTALPSITADLGLTAAERQWVINAYTLCFGGCLMLGGRLADILGRRRVFLAGTLLFTAASVADALAASAGMLIAARAVQGLGAALLAPAALSIVTTTFPAGPRRATAMAGWGAVGAAGGGLGVLAGGALTEYLSWHWIFLINLPIGGLSLVAALAFVRPDAGRGGGREAFDLTGAVTVTAGLALMVMAIVNIEAAGWLAPATVAAAAGATALLSAFVVVERRHPTPLVPLARLRRRTLVGANLAVLLAYGVGGAMLLFVSLYIQVVLGGGPLTAGVAVIPYFVLAVASAGLSERLAPRVGVRRLALTGLLVAAVGVGLLTGVSPDGSYGADLALGIALTGAGIGLAFGPLTLVANNSLGDGDAGLASGLYNTAAQIGVVLGVAVLSTVAEAAGRGASSPAAALADGMATAMAVAAAALVAAALAAAVLLRTRDVAGMTSAVAPAPAAAGGGPARA